MKIKGVWCFLLVFMFFIQLVCAVEVDMKKEFVQGETLIAKISGNFLEPILVENVLFYREHVRVPMVYDVAKIQDQYYIYAILPEMQRNYTLVIKDVKYMKGSSVSEEEIRTNFSISNKTADFNANPGFIVSKADEKFFIKVQNLQDSKITIKISTTSEKETNEGFLSSLFGLGNGGVKGEEITLNPGDIKKIYFENKNITATRFGTISLTSSNQKYEIPVLMIANESGEIKKEKSFRFSPGELNVSIVKGTNETKVRYIYNTGQQKLINISILISDNLKEYLQIPFKEIEELEEGSNIRIEIKVITENDTKYLEGQIRARAGDLVAYMPVYINIVSDFKDLPKNISDDNYGDEEEESCSQLNGKFCKKDETCDGEKKYFVEGTCCIGECKKEGEKSPLGKIIGWGLVVVIFLFLAWFFLKKFHKTRKKPEDLLKIAERR